MVHHQKLVDPSIEPVVYCFMKCQKDPTSISITKTAISNQKGAEMTENEEKFNVLAMVHHQNLIDPKFQPVSGLFHCIVKYHNDPPSVST